jgi:ABC-type antimicrobial peptide transport system permease subunit
LTYAVRTQLPAAVILPAIRNAVQSIDKDLPLRDIRTQNEQIEDSISQERLFATLTAAFGILALILACIGIYGIMAYNVARRTSEIGIRMALGARSRQVLLMILRESSWLAILGVAAGLAAAFALTRFVRTMLYGIQPTDPTTLIAATVILLAIAIAAAYGPARRASRIDPMQALRHE